MMPIDIFINQLIQLGLADSFLEVIDKHYLKITTLYNMMRDIDTNNIKEILCDYNEEDDSIHITLLLYNPIDELVISDTADLSIQVINNGNSIDYFITNNYESEEEIYEARFNGHKESYTPKWS